MKVAWVDLMAVTEAVKGVVPSAGIYNLPHAGKYPCVEFRVGDEHRMELNRFCLNVFANGEILGAWPCRTKTQRRVLRAVCDELDRQEREATQPAPPAEVRTEEERG